MIGGVEGPACHHRRPSGEAPGRRGGGRLRDVPGLDLQAAGPLRRRGRRRVRTAIQTPALVTERNPTIGGGADPDPAPVPDRSGPGRRSAHHLLAPGEHQRTGARHRLTRDHLADPDPPRRGHCRPGQAAQELDSAVPGRAAQPAVAVRLHPLEARRRHRCGDPELAGRPLPLPARLHRPPAGHRPDRGGRVPAGHRRERGARRGPDGQRAGLHHPVRRRPPRQSDPQRLRDRTGRPRVEQKNSSPIIRRPAARWSASTRP
jgi:hypothetical protein